MKGLVSCKNWQYLCEAFGRLLSSKHLKTDQPFFTNKSYLLGAANHVAFDAKLRSFKQLPVSDFLLSTIWLWNADATVYVTSFENALLLKFCHTTAEKDFLLLLVESLTDIPAQDIASIKEEIGQLPVKICCAAQQEEFAFAGVEFKAISDDFEYVYNVDELALLPGSRFKKQRNACRRAEKLGPWLVSGIEPITAETNLSLLEHFCKKMMQQKLATDPDQREALEKEMSAVQRCLIAKESFRFEWLYIKKDEELVGFILFEKYNSAVVVGHFFKTIPGLGIYLLNQLAIELQKRNITYFNFQEDRGVPDLRYFKTQLNPVFQLKSFLSQR